MGQILKIKYLFDVVFDADFKNDIGFFLRCTVQKVANSVPQEKNNDIFEISVKNYVIWVQKMLNLTH